VSAFGSVPGAAVPGAATPGDPGAATAPSPPAASPVVDPSYQAARNGFPGDLTAANHAAQVAQFLATHGITPVYAGNRVWTVATEDSISETVFGWVNPADIGGAGWLPEYDADQPVTLPAGTTAIGRIQVAVQAAGNGADLRVTLYPDNGSGQPLTASPIASATVPASHILGVSAQGSLASAGPLATARYNTAYAGPAANAPWTQPAVSLNGAGNFSTPVTSGNWTLFLGGADNATGDAVGTVSAVQYFGGGAISGAIEIPPLPQAAWYMPATATSDTVIAASGTNQAGAAFTNVWTASWSPSSGAVGAWSAQQALPAAAINGTMAAWGTTVYVIGGTTAIGDANATASVWYATEQNGQISAWSAAPPLPQPVVSPYAAVVGNWLIVAGGQNSSGTPLAATWVAAINGDGSLAGWRPGPALPEPGYAATPGWNTAVTDSAMIIISGFTTSSLASPYTQILAVNADGPAPEWQLQNWAGSTYGEFQSAAYPSGAPGQWEIINFHLTSYDSAPAYTVPLISVPLAASGLTPGDTYHLVFHQAGGDAENNYLQLGEMTASAPPAPWLYSARGSGGPWTARTGHAITVNVYDETPSAGQPMHLYSDSGARITTLVHAPAGGQLLGVMESTALPAGPLNANPSFAGGSTSGWNVTSGTLTATSSPPSGAPSAWAAKYVNNGTAHGGIGITPYAPVKAGSIYLFTAWVYSTSGLVMFADYWFDWGGTQIGAGIFTDFTVPADTWTQIQAALTAPASAAACGWIIETQNADSSTLYITGAMALLADPGQVSAVTQVTYEGSRPSGLLQLA
jgi:hypothetical protein